VESAKSLAAFAFSFREKATVDDVLSASKILFLEKMNPYISRENMVVMYDDDIPGDKTNNLIGFAQIRPLGSPEELEGQIKERIQYHELASLYVKPDYRHQGVGSAIVHTLLQKFDSKFPSTDANQTKHIACLLTLKPTAPFYLKFGFQISPQNNIPPPLRFEYQLGRLVSFVLKNDLVCLIRQNTTEN
jgi:GNAT superfamily N-acetyltransferase